MNDRIGTAQRSINSSAYSVYGYLGNDIRGHRLGYNGQLLDCAVQGYLLGNGNRVYSPVLMRFCSPDVLSPFKAGGVNAYAYCGGDPVNFIDPQGSHRYKSNWTAFEPAFQQIDNSKYRIRGFSYDPAAPKGKRIQSFVAKSLNGKVWERLDPDAEFRGRFYVSGDRRLFIREHLVSAEGIGLEPFKAIKKFTEEGFTLMTVNPRCVRMGENSELKYSPDTIVINDSGMTDYSKLTLPGLAAAIRKGRPGTSPHS
ncbi:RHS repeat-associated core domain-containing protein [Pseudomonas sp. NyZ480]|uniref:RHS repeat-associated core domain-containing protein n=1 Tax=Pseudomonas sp. NyZ480 TaxID=3035289 RepID=UPI00240A2580|nr:RHS repeat-associated core domain-containing protein [Pseudomonas sp. NyZ480]WEZ87212.1 RHS repeat-associated core domain-containing protein [Pseudomonas sp. NyZ480]